MPQAQYQFLLDLANTKFQTDLISCGLAAQDQPSTYDITDRVMEASVRRGRDNELDPFGPGSMTLLLDNTDWRFTPDYGGSPLYGKLRPGAMVTARVPVPDYTNLVSWWTLDEAAASTRYDSHGTNHLSIGTAGTVPQTAGIVGNAAVFNTGNWLRVASNASLQVGDIDFSICGWVYLTSYPTYGFIASKWDIITPSLQWALYYNGSTSRFAFSVSADGASTAATVSASTFGAPSLNTWYYVMAFHDSANNMIGISVNNGTIDTQAYSSGVYASGTADFAVGADHDASLTFAGYIDSVSFWKKVLQPYYVPSGLLTSLVSYWKLDEASGTRYDSVTATANDLTDNNTVTQNPGIISNAAQFTAVNLEYLSHTDNASLSTGDIDFTIAAWFYADTVGAIHTIVAKGSESAGTTEYNLRIRATNVPRFMVSNNGTTQGTVDWSAGISVSTWYFVVAWHDSVANTINIQVNNGTPVSAAWSTGVVDGANDFALGRRTDGGYANGRIDEVGFWKRVLTATERTNLYNGGAGVAYPFVGVP